jgi:hypothetical protein
MFVSGKNIEFKNINVFGGFLGGKEVEITTPADESVDFSGTHTEGAIYSVSGGINIFSNSIIAPSESLGFIIVPNHD